MHFVKSTGIMLLMLVLPATQAWAHHPATTLGSSQGGPLKTSSAQTMPQGKADFGFQTEYFDFDPFSDSELRAFAQAGADVHSTDSVLHFAIMGSYGVTDDLTLSFRLPYVRINGVREAHADEPDEIHRHGDSKGLGDLSFFAQYRFLNSMQYQGSFLLGLKTPTGNTNARDLEEVKFETEFQPGSGSWDPSIGVAFQKGFGSFTLYTNLLYRFVTEGAQDFNLGNAFCYNAAIVYTIPVGGVFWDLIFEANGESRNNQKIAGISDPNSGGELILLSPGLRIRWNRLSATVSAGFPFRQELGGIQNELNYTVLTGLSFAF